MTLQESTASLEELPLDDLAAVAATLTARARAVVEHAAKADLESLQAARSAGQLLIARLIEERRRLLRESNHSRALHDSLSSNLSDNFPRSNILA